VLGVADQQDRPAGRGDLADLLVQGGHKRTGRVDHAQ
jgi:hypothetical protein